MLTSTEQNELHNLLRQQGNLTQDGCWDTIEVFEEFLKEKRKQDTFGSYLLVGRREAIAELILCMRFSNKHDLAQAVLDYIEGLSRAKREKE